MLSALVPSQDAALGTSSVPTAARTDVSSQGHSGARGHSVGPSLGGLWPVFVCKERPPDEQK